MNEAEYKSEFEHTKDTHGAAFCEYFGENWPRYNGTAYILIKQIWYFSYL